MLKKKKKRALIINIENFYVKYELLILNRKELLKYKKKSKKNIVYQLVL